MELSSDVEFLEALEPLFTKYTLLNRMRLLNLFFNFLDAFSYNDRIFFLSLFEKLCNSVLFNKRE